DRPALDRLEHLVSLFDQVRPQRAEILSAIPRTAVLPAEAGHQTDESLEGLPEAPPRGLGRLGQGGVVGLGDGSVGGHGGGTLADFSDKSRDIHGFPGLHKIWAGPINAMCVEALSATVPRLPHIFFTSVDTRDGGR